MDTVLEQRDLVPCKITNSGTEAAYVIAYVSVGHGRWLESLYEAMSVRVEPGQTIEAMVERTRNRVTD